MTAPDEIRRDVNWLLDYADNDARVYVYTRLARDAMIAEGRQRGIKGHCHRWNIGRRAWEFAILP